MTGWNRSTRRPPRPQDDDVDDVGEHRNKNGDDNDDHCGAVETNAGESDGADENWDSPAFSFEAVRQFNTNVIACHMTTGDMRWYIVEFYLAPFDNTTIRYVEAAMVEWPRGAELIFAGDLNVDPERTGGR